MSQSTLGIGLCGYPKAGKTRAARILEDHYSASVLAVESLLSDEYYLSDTVIEDVLANHAAARLGSPARALSVWRRQESDRLLVIVDGVFSPDELAAYQDVFDDFILLYIRKHDEFRFQHFPAKDTPAGRAEFEAVTERVGERGVDALIDQELYDVEVGNDLETNFAEKVRNAVDGAVFRAGQTE